MKNRMETLMDVPLQERYGKLKDILKEHGIRVSHQRLLILDFLVENDIHPTAEEIYKNLKSKDPILSQATVYNTLNLFTDHNIICELDFNQPSKRYDFYESHHSHFLCEDCGEILDLPIKKDNLEFRELEGYEIHSMEIIVRGICPICKKKDLKES